jgi:tRNA(Ile)-lysidine synthase
VERLHQTAAALAADEDILEAAAAEAFSRTVVATASGVEADLKGLSLEPLSLRMRLYRKAILAVKGDLLLVSFSHLSAIDRLVYAARPNSELTLPNGIRIIRSYGFLRFTLQHDDSPPAGSELLLDRSGHYTLPCGGRLLIEERIEHLASGCLAGAQTAEVLYGQFQFPLLIRYYRDGDRFIPLGMNSRKKLKDFFIDRKIPLKKRRSIPLLVDRGEIVWVCGLHASENMRSYLDKNELPCLQITYIAATDRH